MRAPLARLQGVPAGCRDGARAAQRCHLALPFSLAFLASSLGAPGRRVPGARRAGVALSLPLALLPRFNLSATPLPAPRNVQPLDRSVLAAGFGEEGGRRLEERGGGRRVETGGCSGRSGKLRAAFPPQSVEQERGGARRRRRLLCHQTPGLGGAWGHLLLSQEEPSPNRLQPDFFLPISFFFLSLFKKYTFPAFGPQTAAARAFPGLSSWGLPIPPAASKDARPASGEEKKKNLSEGFRLPTVTLFPQT